MLQVLKPVKPNCKYFNTLLRMAKGNNKNGHFVSLFSSDELHNNCKALLLDSNGLYGAAITHSGELIAVFKNAECKESNILGHMIRVAKIYGAEHLECFEPLAPLYEKHGFRVATSTPWNDDYAPADWNYDSGKPNCLTMRL